MTTVFGFYDSAMSRAYALATHREVPAWVVFRPARTHETLLSPEEQVVEGRSWVYEVIEGTDVPLAPSGDPTDIKGYYAPDGEWHPWLLTTSDAADALGVSAARIRQLVAKGALPAHKRGRDLFVRGRDVDALRGRKTTPGPQAGQTKTSTREAGDASAS